MKIFLIGLPGSGKSTIGTELSALLQCKFIDTDNEIIQKEGSNIDEIFKTKGENHFRECEKKVLNEISSINNTVVSTGGGLPCFFDNMTVINQLGVSIFLNVPPAIIADRLWIHNNQNRPLLQGKSKEQLLEFLTTKLKERISFYRQAKLELEGGDIHAKQIATKLSMENLI